MNDNDINNDTWEAPCEVVTVFTVRNLNENMSQTVKFTFFDLTEPG